MLSPATPPFSVAGSSLLSFVDRSSSVGCPTGLDPGTPLLRAVAQVAALHLEDMLCGLCPTGPPSHWKLRPFSSLPSPQASEGLAQAHEGRSHHASEEDVLWSLREPSEYRVT